MAYAAPPQKRGGIPGAVVAIIAAAVVLLLLAVAGLVVVLVYLKQRDPTNGGTKFSLDSEPESLVVSSRGTEVAVVDKSNTVTVISLSDGKKRLTQHRKASGADTYGDDGPPTAFSPDGTMLAIADPDRIDIWNSTSDKITHTITWGKGAMIGVAISPDNQHIAIMGDTQIWLADLNGSTPTPRPLQAGVSSKYDRGGIAYSSDGQSLITWANSYKPVEILRVSDGGTIRSIDQDGYNTAVSPDHTVVGVGGSNGINRYSVATGSRIGATISGKNSSLYGFALNNDGSRVAVPTYDGVYVYDGTSGQQVGDTIKGERYGIVEACVFTPDNKKLVLGYRDHLEVKPAP